MAMPRRGAVRTHARGGRSDRDALKAVSRAAIEALTRVDGTASGIKFNKLVYHIHKAFSRAENRSLHFSLPHRWYLYGAVVDLGPLYGSILSRNPEEEMLGDFTWNGGRTALHVSPDFETEAPNLASAFARKYAGPEGVAPMLREHYSDAPLQFQRDYLEWSLTTDDMVRGRTADSPAAAAALFQKMESSYPRDLEPRLNPIFNRLWLYLDPLVGERGTAELGVLRWQAETVRDFWRVFCLFLSSKYNTDLPREAVEHYQTRALEELVAYKRRFSAFLSHEYAEKTSEASRVEGTLGNSISGAISESLAGGGPE